MIKKSELSVSQLISTLIVRAIDCGAYLAFVEINGKEHLVTDNAGKPLKSYNKLGIQKLFKGYQVQKTVLQHDSAYDEMIGQPTRLGSNRLEVPLGKLAP